MALIDVFIKGRRRSELDASTVKRFPYLVWTDVILLAFFIFATYSRYRIDPSKYRLFFVLVLATSLAFPISLLLLRAARLRAASYLSTQALLVNMLWLGIFLPAPGPTYVYRTAAMLMASNVAALIVSLSDGQLYVFAGESLACWFAHLAVALVRMKADPAELAADTHSALAVGSILFVCVLAMLCLARRHSTGIYALAEAETLRNRGKLEELRGLVRGAKDSFEIGDYLKKRAGESAQIFAGIASDLDGISAEARSLAATAEGCRQANRSVSESMQGVRGAVIDQNAALDEASAAIQEVIATIASIGKVSKEKQGGIRALVEDLDSRRGQFQKAREGIARIDRTSSRVAAALSSIVDISERVNLLAMNASIEAAHLGAAGRGFAVIAQEMRGLSDQTMSSAKAIEASLGENEDAVRNASEAITSFTAELEQVTGECRRALDGIGEILNGVQEIGVGNREIQEATVSLVANARAIEGGAGGVLERIGQADRAVERFDSFARELSGKIEAIDGRFKGIRALVDDIDRAGARNVESIGKLKAGMETAGQA